ncbi:MULTISPECIES: DUF805 domain-containing protein [unclassified Streptomyces]|jgi:uncharacterized membrane protein YhaH (DUF805 family)|uniref:DUF805 domain-containing protein n=1 Tax=unclassified Streptomyces TaxID=2593676 RepID=UPI000F508910|nr:MULTISPECIES: DUF805 domain-containing protein [unclassified Streptomyces]MDH6452003.1 uncharacterized membrane protein YhaH (DUF805 family) [Streptomyces sp. SAI-119]MDH6497444.1 uncharacterized membrane protein YhaH (DUF805 family) [Streptomyces sp. SAI-149]QUC55849.1 DUF805 domain-containing protein [Streptomyces sp. A2-16]
MSWFIEVLKKYAVFSGRARRKEYWMFALFAGIIYVVFAVLGVVTKQSWLVAIPYLGFLLPGLAVTARRLHDTGRSGWWILFGLVPLVGGITLFVFSVLDSEPGDNKYGPNPKLVPAHV